MQTIIIRISYSQVCEPQLLERQVSVVTTARRTTFFLPPLRFFSARTVMHLFCEAAGSVCGDYAASPQFPFDFAPVIHRDAPNTQRSSDLQDVLGFAVKKNIVSHLSAH